MPPRKSIRSVGLLDTIIILVLAFTADLLLLWIASQIRGLNLFEHLPPWLTALSKSVWSYMTGGASAVVLAFLRRRIKSTTASPNYLLWSGGAAIAILMMVAVTTKLLAPPVVVDLGFRASEFDLKFRVHPATNAGGTSQAQGSRLRPLLAFQQRNPKVRERENIALQPDGLYKAVCDLPARCGQFMARAYGVETESEMRVDPTSPPLEISFVRSAKDPVAARTTPEVLAECDEGQNCSISKLDLGWASDGQSCNSTSRGWLPRLVAVAYALEPTTDQVQPGWRVPSLQTLNSMKDREKVGYTKFLIKSGPLPSLSAADAFTYLVKVNGTPIYVDGARPEDMIEPFNPSEGISFAFGLENLNFSGADQGCENISVALEFRKQNQVIQRAEFTRKYAALRDAEPETIQSKDGINLSWSGQYVKPQKEDRFEVFIRSTPDVQEAARIKARLDKAGLRFHDMEAVGVVRPPLDQNAFGVVVGLRQPTGQIRFTFDREMGYALMNWIKEVGKQPQLAGIIHQQVFLYQMRPGESGTGKLRACSARSASL